MSMYQVYCILYWLFVLVKLFLMDRNLGKGAMDQPKYSSVETINDGYGSANQRFFPDPSSNMNINMRPPEYNVSVGTRPVLNYSIQTGEEFSLEFMRERVNSRQHLLVPHASGDPNSASRVMGLKSILAINNSGSESGSDVSMVNLAEKDHVQEYDRKTSPLENQSYYDSVRSPQPSSRNDINRGLSHASSGVSDSSLGKVKFLCSFGGKILPRPKDGKLRYVGGETRIIRITRDIFWQDLMQKLLAVYEQTHTIKYQLPGEDLDALVSVSSDEDLQNMMEECLQDGGSQRPRMFLFSSVDVEESKSVEGDSEIQYVVAVNGMDLGSKKNSLALGSSLGNNLEELLSLSVAKGSIHTVPDTMQASAVPSVVEVTSSVDQSSHSAVPGSSSAYENNSQLYQGQQLHSGDTQQHPLSALNPAESFLAQDEQTSVLLSVPALYDFCSQPPNYVIGENVGSMPIFGQPIQQGGVIEDRVYAGIHGQDTELPIKDMGLKRDSSNKKLNRAENVQPLAKDTPLKEARMTRESSLQKINEIDKVRNLDNENSVSVNPYDGSVPNCITGDEVSVGSSVAETGSPLLTTRINKKLLEPRQNSATSEGVGDGQKNNGDDRFHTAASQLSNPGYGGSEVDPRFASSDVDSRYAGSEVDSMDFSYLEQPVIPPRVYHSERIPREQLGLNRLSKSGDSFGSPFIVAQAHSDHKQPSMESVEKLHDENVSLQSEQPVLPSKLVYKNPQTVEEGIDQNVQRSDSKNVVSNSGDGRETGRLKDNYGDRSINDKQAALTQLRAGQETSLKPTDDSASVPPEYEWTEISGSKDYGNNGKGHVNPVTQKQNSITGGGNGESAAGVGTTDILIDINDRFPRDFMSDIFSKAETDPSGVSPLPGDGAGLSLNMENHEPMHWSYFRNLAQNEFVRKDVSLMDQDHLGFISPLTGIGEGAPVDYSFPPLKSAGVLFGHNESHISFDEDIRQDLSSITGPTTINADNPSLPEGIESEQVDGVNHRVQESEYEDDKLDNNNTGVPHGDLSLETFDITTLQIISNEDLEELRELGSGTFGTVYHGKWRGTDVAIKRIKKSCFTGRSSEQERLTIEFWREAEILSKLHHPNVVAFYGVVQDGPGATMATVAEFMVNGSLRHVLLSKERHLDRRKRLIIAMDAAFGMEYLHSKNIVHFDLKCDNLLVNLKDPLRPICKVGDFGLSKIKRNTLVTGGVRGTLPWMAPELLSGSSSKVSEKVDVFSFGIVLWEILTGEEPYANMHYGAIIGGIVNNTLRPHVPGYCDAEWKLLMEQCWAPDPTIRPSFTEIARRLRVMSAACQTKPQQQQNQVAK
ncbi:uncharacterized protein LOC126785660 [Argentina anserina]|uniref:uncharacterized protein LOC126785660 n=1 Tax=Argentina anserina TaxID=57926 RepID=UPI0021768C27|nr:uncharacterized protein LOC126785660 [Potentilla anserina]